ncbi:DNA-3-methyladenine glycosylase I [Lentilactobacillus hilgardii]|jgi:DNA-3-methyladenine glycosylase I|uniref:DNA-3-methyladenine glycosylase I n=1 Tax=Lentilactobacillus hilgardii TaxID=1588 RepID=A0A6P1E2P7_LENHI|nr:DNA-3-methyladenine glycosylase I [Lentilactobacillus hilgardii]RRG12337.1 MAG: DNA-3-methyladenine glycosylase I [Lactobacillus sp.]EEI71545.1 DNA-3-methyladenine glycosylase I [Lentilactobacillus hilgardii ATCC 27305]MCT3392096.1 DNA-3-methyladenine glycosylase I [Lentilactobacillus hilgardii]MCT3399903.1 DNA-3-methyladenine glycosylase I [Lentilactobacillus hilgardii]QHB51586.1 DNA-3-methyladenine glycosylase I [Lentilactobacillus hilgardii]
MNAFLQKVLFYMQLNKRKFERRTYMVKSTNGVDLYHSLFGTEIHDPRVMFEMLTVNIFQPGLNWRVAASKLPVFDKVFKHFEVAEIAKFDEMDLEALEENPDMIRNPRKIRAVVQDARATLNLSPEFKDLADYLWSFKPKDNLVEGALVQDSSTLGALVARDMKKRGFTFVGPTTIELLLVGTGVLKHINP